MINRVVLVGRITKDPELRKAGSGEVVSFTIAINRRYANKDGNKEADFINCVAWNQTANFLSTYVKKGNLIGVEGRIETRNYDGNDGKKVYITEVRCESVQILESKNSSASIQTYQKEEIKFTKEADFDKDYSSAETFDIESDELPFY